MRVDLTRKSFIFTRMNHTCRCRNHTMHGKITLVPLVITLVRVEIISFMSTSHFSCRHHTLREKIGLVRVDITLCAWKSCFVWRNYRRVYWNHTRACVLNIERVLSVNFLFSHVCLLNFLHNLFLINISQQPKKSCHSGYGLTQELQTNNRYSTIKLTYILYQYG
jgi:hypothetical protein